VVNISMKTVMNLFGTASHECAALSELSFTLPYTIATAVQALLVSRCTCFIFIVHERLRIKVRNKRV